MKVENEDVSGEDGQNRWQKRPWEDDYEIDKPYTGSHPWGSEYPQKSSRWQNSRPVAGQFMADAKPKITSPHKAEQAVDPFSESFKRQLAASGGNLKRVKDAVTNGGRKIQESTSATEQHTIAEGDVVEHQRFGIGTVIKVEGVGENERATIEFRNTDKKTLLLKFARIKIISKKQ
jgi:DNA helicase-2/ATP-dependent DNA helicase PcrA